jgi:hypothetical protein
MWSSAKPLFAALDFSRRLSCGGGVLLASTLLVNNRAETAAAEGLRFKWKTIEYPEAKPNEVPLSRKVFNTKLHKNLWNIGF